MSRVTDLLVALRLAAPLHDGGSRVCDCLADMFDADVSYGCTQGVASLLTSTPHEEGVDPVEVAMRIASAARQLGAEVTDVEDDIVDLREIAARTEVTHEAARKWAQRRDFPQPFAILTGGSRVWDWASVERWLRNERPDRADGRRQLSTVERARLRIALAAERTPPKAVFWLQTDELVRAVADFGGLYDHSLIAAWHIADPVPWPQRVEVFARTRRKG